MEVMALMAENTVEADDEEPAVAETTSEIVKPQVMSAVQPESPFSGGNSIFSRELMNLEKSRLEWEQSAYHRANTELYELLSRCQSLTIHVTKHMSATSRIDTLKMFCEKRDIAYNADSPLATQIVRAVFGILNRRRVSVYSIVVRAAIANKIKPEGLAAWITESNGVEAIRLAQSKNFVSPKRKSEVVAAAYNERSSIATIRDENLSRRANAEKVGEYCLLLAKQGPSGEFNIYEVVSQTGAVNAACVSLYGKVKPT